MFHGFRRILLLVGAMLALAVVPALSHAKPSRVTGKHTYNVTGKQTTITPSSQTASFLAAHKITISAVAPATISNGTATFPIVGGKVKTPSLNGRLIMDGGLRFTRKHRSFTLRNLVATHHGSSNAISARVAHRRVDIAHASNVHVAISGKTGTVTGELKLSRAAARLINRLARHHVVSPGADLGSFTSTVTVA